VIVFRTVREYPGAAFRGYGRRQGRELLFECGATLLVSCSALLVDARRHLNTSRATTEDCQELRRCPCAKARYVARIRNRGMPRAHLTERAAPSLKRREAESEFHAFFPCFDGYLHVRMIAIV
jgi:hypothetical protein